jgi:hypothetical protein
MRRRIQAEPKVITQQVIDPKVLELRQLFKEFKERREVRIDLIESYLDRHFAEQETLRADEFKIDTIEDYICFSYIRHLASLGKKAKKVADQFNIQFNDQYTQVAGMVECRDFVIYRKR